MQSRCLLFNYSINLKKKQQRKALCVSSNFTTRVAKQQTVLSIPKFGANL